MDREELLRQSVLKLGVLLVTVAVLWVVRPLIHPLVYGIMYSPGLLYAFGIPVVVAVILYLAPPLTSETRQSSVENKAVLVGGVFAVGVALTFSLGLMGGFVEERTLAEETMAEVEMIDGMPEINADNPRIVPRAVADIQTRGSVSYRTHRLGESDIARMEDGRLAWTYPIQPDQFNNRLNDNQRGILLSDMTAIDNRELVAVDDQPFTYGQGHLLHRSIQWQLLTQDYTTKYIDDPIEFTSDGEAYMAFLKTGHEWRLSPVPHTIPVWDGVALVHQDGTIEHLSPEEAQESDILDGQRLYPLYNAERRGNSLLYREGITNTLPLVGSFTNAVVPAQMPSGADNNQPFVIDLEGEQMTYVMAMEPPGADSRGLDEVWFFDAASGEAQVYGTEGDTLLGPERATGIVRSEDSRTDWQTETVSGQFKVVEPVPVTVDSELWWHTKVTPTDDTDVTRNVFVNAHTGEAIEIQDTESIIEFLRGTGVDSIDGVSEVGENGESSIEPAPSDSDADFVLVVRDDDGNVIERIPFESGYDVSIEQRVNSTHTDD